MPDNALYVIGMLSFSVWISEWLVQKTWLKHLGTALVVIILVAILANIGLVPTASANAPVYQGIFSYVAPLAIFFLLLNINLENLRKAGSSMILLFAMGSIGTMLGVFVGMYLINGEAHLGKFYPAIAGMLTGTYTGGSINFNAVAIHYRVMDDAVLYAGTTAVDNIISALWMIVTLIIPLLLRKLNQGPNHATNNVIVSENNSSHHEKEAITITSVSLLFALGFFALFFSEILSDWCLEIGFTVPSILILTTLALVLAQIPVIHRLRGGQVLGLFCIYLFLAVIGAYCEFAALAEIGSLAWRLFFLVTIIVMVHGLWMTIVVILGKFDIDMASVASQANIGGSSSAIALAESLNRQDLLLPGILVGALGNGIGTYLGFLMAGWFST
jgi:uncharacterized membrane protein